jgi:hypothetical protein
VDVGEILTLKGREASLACPMAWLGHRYSALVITSLAPHDEWLPGKARRRSRDLSLPDAMVGERALLLCRVRRRTRDMSAQHWG